MTVKLSDVKAAQPDWFSLKNKRLFGDVSYRVLKGKVSGKPFLVRATYAWTDMFGQPKRLHYRVNPLRDDLTVGPLVDGSQHPPTGQFRDIDAVKDWLAGQ